MSIINPDIPDQLLLDKYALEPSQFMNLDGFKIHYRDEGKKDGQPV